MCVKNKCKKLYVKKNNIKKLYVKKNNIRKLCVMNNMSWFVILINVVF